MDSAPNRIAEMRKRRGLSQAALAALCNTSNQQISRLETSKRELSVQWLVRLGRALECRPINLLSNDLLDEVLGSGEDESRETAGGDGAQEAPFLLLEKPRVPQPPWPIPVWDGSDSYCPRGCMHFSEAFLRKYGVNPINCEVVGVGDDSMEPTLPQRSACLIDRDKTELIDGALYAVLYDGTILVRRAIKTRGEWVFQADDPTKPLLLGTSKVLGFVLWVGSVGPKADTWQVPEDKQASRDSELRATG